MRSICTCFALVGGAALAITACDGGSAGDLFPDDAGLPAIAGRGGRTGRAGAGGRAGTGGRALDAGVAGRPDAGAQGGAAGSGEPCQDDDDCVDGDACTTDSCQAGRCAQVASPEGTACGSERDDACTQPDTCNAEGVCEPNDQAEGTACGEDLDGDCVNPGTCDAQGACVLTPEANGAACTGGSCAVGECIEGQPVGCPAEVVTAVPFTASWRTVGGVDLFGGGCDVDNTPDFAVVFTAPTSATFRFEAAGLVGTDDPENTNDDGASELADSVITIAEGSCQGGAGAQLGCNDDVTPGENLDSRVDLPLTAGQVVTVYASELREVLPGGGSGTLTITQLAD